MIWETYFKRDNEKYKNLFDFDYADDETLIFEYMYDQELFILINVERKSEKNNNYRW